MLLLLCLAGCGSSKQEMASPSSEKSTVDSSQLGTSGNKEATTEERKIMQTATLSLKTSNLKNTEEKIISIINTNQGRADEINVTRDDYNGQSKGIYIVRVPQEQLAHVIDSIINIADISLQQKKTVSQDVTEEYIDTTARLENMQHQEQRLRELLTKADSIDEILKVENELVRVRTQIDSNTGKIKKMSSQITMSTIKITVMDNGIITQNTFITQFLGAMKEGFKTAGDVFMGIIVFTISLSPLGILLIIAIYGYRRLKRGRKNLPKKEE